MVPHHRVIPAKAGTPMLNRQRPNRGPRLRGDDPVVALSGEQPTCPRSNSSTPPIPSHHFHQTYLRSLPRAYTPHIRPPLGRTSTANDAGVGQADAGGSSLPWDRRRPPDSTEGSARLRSSRRPADREARASHTKTHGAYAPRGLRSFGNGQGEAGSPRLHQRPGASGCVSVSKQGGS